MQRLLPSDSQYQTHSLCRMEMQHSTPSEIKQPDMKTKGQAKEPKAKYNPTGKGNLLVRSNWSMYLSLAYSQSPYNHKSLNCYLQKMPRWRVSITEVASHALQIYYLYRSAFKEHKDDIGRSNFVTNQEVFCSHTSKLQKFTCNCFVYFCLAKHLSNTDGTYLTWSRICSPPDQHFIFITCYKHLFVTACLQKGQI